MLDPIGDIDGIRKFFIAYIRTAFRIRNDADRPMLRDLAERRERLLMEPGQLCADWFIEPLPRYQAAECSIEDVVDGGVLPVSWSEVQRLAAVKLLLSGLFPAEKTEGENRIGLKGTFKPYSHQIRMLRRGLEPSAPAIITSGTGSGKTESFLAPIIAQIMAEATHPTEGWQAPGPGFLTPWWLGTDGLPLRCRKAKSRREDGTVVEMEANRSPAQKTRLFPSLGIRQGETRPRAVRALILYPMNALVEDQMVRLRKALDSREARSCLDAHANKNRIFFGRYTSATPDTGSPAYACKTPSGASEAVKSRHAANRAKAVRMSKMLHEASLTQREARAASNGNPADVTPSSAMAEKDHAFQFPSVDGAESPTRWDMQVAPPDILITNVSMLNAMLTRQVEVGIFDCTREWLEKPGSYFYLVLDELHLHRGAAGSEMAFLLKTLIHRLGLHEEGKKGKLRILASSASLPDDAQNIQKSCDYLFDLFGTCGHGDAAGQPDPDDETYRRKLWSPCIIKHDLKDDAPVDLQTVMASLPAFKGISEAADDVKSEMMRGSWSWATLPQGMKKLLSEAGTVLGTTITSDVDLVGTIGMAGRILESGVIKTNKEDPNKLRAVSAHALARTIFGTPVDLSGLRGLMMMRATGDYLDKSLKRMIAAPSFRIHAFLRSFEGLFATVDQDAVPPGRDVCHFADLQLERSPNGAPNDRRRFQLLYCECCGEVMLGGMRGSDDGRDFELLPTPPDLDGLPDTARTAQFEDLSHADYALVWPTSESETDVRNRTDPKLDIWEAGKLDPMTGRWTMNATDGIPALAFKLGLGIPDKKRKKANDRGSAVPFACPSCGTDFSPRKPGGRARMSPIRGFRPGFGKTTQLLASELYAVAFRSEGDKAKLISFSDSRQEAARAALDIQDNHHQDLMREIVYSCARERAKDFGSSMAGAKIARLEDIIERRDKMGDDAYNDPNESDQPIIPSPVVAAFASRGLNPADPLGHHAIRADGEKWFKWTQILGTVSVGSQTKDIRWISNPAEQESLKEARRNLIDKTHRQINSVILGRSYFSFEEAGLGFAVVGGILSDEAKLKTAPILRILADAYRVDMDQYRDAHEVEAWDIAAKAFEGKGKMSAACVKAVEKIYGADARSKWTQAWKSLGSEHPAGRVKQGKLSLVLVDTGSPFWRCHNCGRVHLYPGLEGRCTRCGTELAAQTGTAAELRDGNFLGQRIKRGDRFSLRCEELTGQTDDYGQRQRHFRGIFLPTGSDAPASGESEEEDLETEISERIGEIPDSSRIGIDLLAVTTTMEVGIDIGNLRSVLQANMPPQRFNYQQRVGRAGRRGQAFSCVLTVCRSRSHDLHYFKHPDEITGAPPPPPFLTLLPDIPERILRKQWMIDAFRRMALANSVHPANDSRDIHGEFIDIGDWDQHRGDLKRALGEVASDSEERRVFFTRDLRMKEKSSPRIERLGIDSLMADIEKAITRPPMSDGLGERLADSGIFPMFGMPTRIRSIYHGLSVKGGQKNWRSVDRDIDLAIFEFAPGRILTKDKRRFQAIGLAPALINPPIRITNNGDPTWASSGSAIADGFALIKCPACSCWSKREEAEAAGCCPCGAPLEDVPRQLCRTPAAFIARFHEVREDAMETPASGRSILAEATPISLESCGTNCLIGMPPEPHTIRVNLGPEGAGYRWQTGNLMIREASLPDVCLGRDQAPTAGWVPTADSGSFSLAARKITHLMMLRPAAYHEHLALHELRPAGTSSDSSDPEHAQWAGIRSAAISATFLLTSQAALDMDIDPDEFDILEPRKDRQQGRREAPLLQFADKLVNGAGYVRWLGEKMAGGERPIAEIIHWLVSGESHGHPSRFRADLFADAHSACHESCYGCLQRYRNQAYHALLDWRLGLDFLAIMADPSYDCGLTGTKLYPWQDHDEQRMRKLLDRFRKDFVPQARLSTEGAGMPTLLLESDRRAIILRHPLWSPTALAQTAEPLMDQGIRVKSIDTFNLIRRPSRVAGWVRDAFNALA